MSHAFPGDEVFFHHKGQPKVGKVKCAGRHGCTVHDEDGDEHKLKWEHLAGFKMRSKQDYKVLHNGEDGVIVENQHGQRRYLGIPPDSKPEKATKTKR
jgi:hypothetical protein